jgi:hypothetical protein
MSDRPFVVISGQTNEAVQQKLDESAPKGYRPILMSTCATQNGIWITVILELA